MRRSLPALLLLLLGLTVIPVAEARTSQRMLFQAPRELRSGDPALRAATLDELQSLGVGWLRLVVYWNDVAPRPDTTSRPRFDERDPASYDWSR
jgi:hypothetical protein